MGGDVEPVALGRGVDARPVVVTAIALRPAARRVLADLLGGVIVADLRDTVDEADVVLAPSCSPQTLAALKAAFPTARLVVAELEDDTHEIEFSGPVMRLLRSGADAYVTADSLDDLARQLTGGAREPAADLGQLAAARASLPTPGVDETVLADLEVALAARKRRIGRRRRGSTTDGRRGSGRPT